MIYRQIGVYSAPRQRDIGRDMRKLSSSVSGFWHERQIHNRLLNRTFYRSKLQAMHHKPLISTAFPDSESRHSLFHRLAPSRNPGATHLVSLTVSPVRRWTSQVSKAAHRPARRRGVGNPAPNAEDV
jgi:hypothetical protein